jgi:hypothetical protein
MSLPPHVHCGECGREIAATVPEKGGKLRPAPIRAGQQLMPVMTPDGPAFVPRAVPLCDGCAERIDAKATRSKLVVPGRVL